MAQSEVVDNGLEPPASGDSRLSTRALPEFVVLTKNDLQAFPSPGTQRALKAQVGKDYMALVGPDADSADRTQTQVWTKLRRTIPDLLWDECAEVGMIVDDEGLVPADPTQLTVSELLPRSVGSGG